MASMRDITRNGTRLEQLRELALVIAGQIDDSDGEHSMAQLARQYRETLAEIAEIEASEGDDGIADIMQDG